MTTAQRCIEQLTQSIIEGGIFDIPDGIQFEKKHSDKGDWYYTVRHDVLGELGRLHVLPKGNRALRFLVEVLNDCNELVEQQRQDILEPIVDKVLAVLKRAFDCEMDDFEKNHPTSASAGCEEINFSGRKMTFKPAGFVKTPDFCYLHKMVYRSFYRFFYFVGNCVIAA